MMRIVRIMILLRRKGRSTSLCCPAAGPSLIGSTETLPTQFLFIVIVSEWCLACFLRLRLHEEWLEKERLAQEEFRLRSEREEAARKRKEEEEVIYCLYSS